MPLNEKTQAILNEVIRSDEDQVAFDAGYNVGSSPDQTVALGGPTRQQWEGGIFASVDESQGPVEWVSDRLFSRGAKNALVDNPAFILGCVVAALENKLANTQVEA